MKRQVSGIAIALLMIGLVIGVGLSAPIYAQELPYNETDAKEFDPDILPWDNETDIIILPWDNETAINERLDNIERMLVEMRDVVDDIKYGLFGARVIHRPTITPDPVTNETDVVITDPLEELNLRIEFLSTNLHDLRMELSSLQSVDRDHKEEVEELVSKIAAMETTFETYSNEVSEQTEYLEAKISGLQNTIMWVTIGAGIIVILCAVVVTRKGGLR